MRGQAQAHSSVAKGTDGARDTWRTPKVVLDRVRKVGRIVLDPCGNSDNSTGAARVFSGPDGNGLDGLAESWKAGLASFASPGIVFANWIYSQSLPWMVKIVEEADAGAKIVGLGPCRLDTRWHRLAMTRASCFAAWRGRLTFELSPGVEIYKVTDNRITAAELSGEPGIFIAKPAKGYLYVEAQREVMETFITAGLEAKAVGPSPAPFPSALYFFGISPEEATDAFGDVADVYLPPFPRQRFY